MQSLDSLFSWHATTLLLSVHDMGDCTGKKKEHWDFWALLVSNGRVWVANTPGGKLGDDSALISFQPAHLSSAEVATGEGGDAKGPQTYCPTRKGLPGECSLHELCSTNIFQALSFPHVPTRI